MFAVFWVTRQSAFCRKAGGRENDEMDPLEEKQMFGFGKVFGCLALRVASSLSG